MIFRCLLFGLVVTVLSVITTVLIVESNESYWWYGPVERMNWLVGVAAAVDFAAFLIPLIWFWRRRRG